ncbi:Sodium-dependent lysophosphatidylcholine symporter 1 [Geodia barretti]|uniref:Sodium-dependent lysophosphatidylcholine symporter 1 n=1 Tax=Geodia barretti TaxID=519541 RepID=A0AA35R1Y3_GEOBA|nr:Sodium-dependent lysophosphatidylcholine symporter 1 [Geodia barretti]
MLWFVPPSFTETASYLKFIYYILFYFAFQLLLTCIHVPYTSLTMHLSNSNKERDSATLYRMLFEVLGTLVGIGVYTATSPALYKVRRSRHVTVESGNETLIWRGPIVTMPSLSPSSQWFSSPPPWLPSENKKVYII